MLRLLTAGESHGEALVAILDGMPSNLKISISSVNEHLRKRQHFYGRGKRMAVEKDTARLISGVIKGKTTGSPISIIIKNKDFSINKLPLVTSPRPGHADLVGALKYNSKDIKTILERSSARETATRVGVGAVCREFLSNFNVDIISYVLAIGDVQASIKGSFSTVKSLIKKSALNCPDKIAEKRMIKAIDSAGRNGDTLGGCFEVIIKGACPGIGSFTQPDKRLSARFASALMSIPAIKAVEIGDGVSGSKDFGSQVHDEIFYSKQKGFFRKTNRSGGIEGGMSTGNLIVLRCYMKPISTLMNPLNSVDLISKKSKSAEIIRSDVCAVSSAGIIAESQAAFVLADAYLEKFGSDSMEEVKRNYQGYLRQVKNY